MNDILEEFVAVEKKSRAALWVIIINAVLLLLFLVLQVSFYADIGWNFKFSDPEVYVFTAINLLLGFNIFSLAKRYRIGWVTSTLTAAILLSFGLYLSIEHFINNPPVYYLRPIVILACIFSISISMLALLYTKETRQQFQISQSTFFTVTAIGSGILLIAFLFAS